MVHITSRETCFVLLGNTKKQVRWKKFVVFSRQVATKTGNRCFEMLEFNLCVKVN